MGIFLASLLLAGCSAGEVSSHEVAESVAKEITCPEPAKKEYRAWGKSGLSVGCRIDHGPFVAIENGVVSIRGQYEHGQKVGRWITYDKEGNVYDETDSADAEKSSPVDED
ncbi:hypothetical protein [Luteimonas sp. R10]|uniref:hypothetical protein n=1 Tax=Luteimonas sp. R10 TaxID=3108176 RepID=UPI003093D5D0|nr:hypothetical protein U3649_01235 [Luteimonas sp. R10]